MTVLVVDDSASIRLFVGQILEDMGVHTELVDSGEAALTYLTDTEHRFPSLVILDIDLPGIDGYETATNVKAIAGDRHLPIIFLTASKAPDVLSRCLSIGDDFIGKPFSIEVIASKVRAHRRVSQLYQQLDAQYQELKRYHHQISLEHDLVESIFQRHFKHNFIDAENFRYHISPKSVFNGDVLLAAYGPSGNLYIFVGDVTGHGLPAAVGALPVYPAFLTMARKGLSVGAIAAELNRALQNLLPDNMLMAASILELNSAADQLTIWSGGLPAAILADDQGNIKQLVESAHCPLAMLSEHEFIQDLQVLPVGPNDRLYLVTDGVEESRNSEGEMFGESRLHRLFDGGGHDMYAHIIQQLEQFTLGGEQDDDITLIELACTPVSGEARQKQRQSEVAVLPWSLTLQLGVDEIKAANPIPQIVRLLSNAIGVDVHQDFISTLLSELFSNALEHGLLRLESSMKASDDGFLDYYMLRKERLEQLTDGTIEITISLRHEDDGSRVAIRVKDSGGGFDYQSQRAAREEQAHGRGMTIVQELCESVEYSEGGTCVTACYRL